VTVPASGGGTAGSTVALDRLGGPLAVSRPRIAPRPLSAWLGLGALFACTALVVLVSNSQVSFPGWLAGPLHGLFGDLTLHRRTLNAGFSGLIAIMTLAYLVTLYAARSLSMRAVWVFVGAAAAILVLSPPLQFTDLFNYLGYARLGALHHLNPYTHVIGVESFDPVSRFATWSNWRSPYGTLFTALTYPLAWLPLSAAYWIFKVVTVLLSVVFVWLIYKCARLLGRDPRLPVLLVAANPVFLIYAVGEFHNDFFMLVPAMAAIALLLSGRYRSAGAAMAVAMAVKYTVVLLLPFLLIAAWQHRKTLRLLGGVVLGAIPLAVLSFALFGLSLPNVGGQSQLLTDFSIPNMLGWAVGLGGGAPRLVQAMNLVIVATVLYQLLRRRDWLSGAGWATLALLVSLGWLMPWYVVWLLPLAAIAANARLRAAALAVSVLVLLSFEPVIGNFLHAQGVNPFGSRVGKAARTYQDNAQNPPIVLRR
jgi:hypothetical protein